MNLLFCTFWLFVTSHLAFAAAPPDIDVVVRRAQAEFGGEIYAGWGFARDIVSHAALGRELDPREIDLAVIGSELSRDQAINGAQKLGMYVRTAIAYRESVGGQGLFVEPVGFIVIIDREGKRINFKFFDNRELAHGRGVLNIETILFKFGRGGLDQLLANVQKRLPQGQLPLRGIQTPLVDTFVSDPFGGIEAWLYGTPVVVNWPFVARRPFESAIRIAMLFANRGHRGPLPEPLRSDLIRHFDTNGATERVDPEVLQRAKDHRQSWAVYEMLRDLGVLTKLPTRHSAALQTAKTEMIAQETIFFGRLVCGRVFAR